MVNRSPISATAELLLTNLIPHLHNTTGCQTRCTTGLTIGWMFVYMIQPVVKPVVQPVEQTATVRSTGCQTGLYNQFDNWLYTRYSRFSNGFDNWLNICIHDTTGCQTGLTTSLTTGCIMYTNIQPVVKPV